MKTKEAIERVRSRFNKWALDEEDLEALCALGLATIESEDEKIRRELLEYAKGEVRSYENMVSGDYDSRDKEDKKMHEWWKKIVSYLEKQKEQSITANDLDEEIHRFFDDCIDVHEAKLYGSISERVIPVDCYELTARHFAKWGEKQKEQKPLEITPNQFDGITYGMNGYSSEKPSEWSEEDERRFISCMGRLQTADGSPHGQFRLV